MKIKKTSREIKIHHTAIVDGIPYYRNESLTYDTNGILAEHKLDWSVGDEEGEGPYVTPGGTLDHIKKETPESLEEKFTPSSRTLRNYAKSKLFQNSQNPKLGTSDVYVADLYSGYTIRFNEADAHGNIVDRDAININDFEQMKMSGAIVDYEIDDNGVKIIMKFSRGDGDLETKIIECLKEADDKLGANDFNRLAESIIDYVDEIARSKKNVV